MDVAGKTDCGQARLWNGSAGYAWAETQQLLDRLFKPFEGLLVGAVSATPRSHVLDVGCGAGATTLAVARMLGPAGRCTGIDISDPMIAVAKARAKRKGIPAAFLHADAQTYSFDRGSFDMIISRFGVMFFDDSVAAFENLLRSAKERAELRLIVWRSPSENPFMTTAERAAAPLLSLPARRPNEPGQFAFAEARWVRRMLEESGWIEIDVRPIDISCSLPEAELLPYLERLGPVGRALEKVDDNTRTQVIEAVRPAFAPYIHGAEVRFTAACWMVRACAPRGARMEAEPVCAKDQLVRAGL